MGWGCDSFNGKRKTCSWSTINYFRILDITGDIKCSDFLTLPRIQLHCLKYWNLSDIFNNPEFRHHGLLEIFLQSYEDRYSYNCSKSLEKKHLIGYLKCKTTFRSQFKHWKHIFSISFSYLTFITLNIIFVGLSLLYVLYVFLLQINPMRYLLMQAKAAY